MPRLLDAKTLQKNLVSFRRRPKKIKKTTKRKGNLVYWLLLSYYPLLTPYKKSASHDALCALFAIRNNKHISFAVNLGKVRNSYDQRQSLRFKFIENVEDESHDNLDAQCLCQSLVSNDRIVVRRG